MMNLEGVWESVEAMRESVEQARGRAEQLARSAERERKSLHDLPELERDCITLAAGCEVRDLAGKQAFGVLADYEEMSKNLGDALSRLCRAKLAIDALRRQSRGLGEIGKPSEAAQLHGACDVLERALGTTSISLKELVRIAMERPGT